MEAGTGRMPLKLVTHPPPWYPPPMDMPSREENRPRCSTHLEGGAWEARVCPEHLSMVERTRDWRVLGR